MGFSEKDIKSEKKRPSGSLSAKPALKGPEETEEKERTVWGQKAKEEVTSAPETSLHTGVHSPASDGWR